MLGHPAKSWVINTNLFAVGRYGQRTEMRPRNEIVALAEPQAQVIDFANPSGALDDGVKNRLHVGRRAADDAEHLCRRRLMLQMLSQCCIALLKLREQAYIFDRDNGLACEGLEQSDLLFAKGSNFYSTNQHDPDGSGFPQ